MNARGFNLFTALVSFIIIALAVLLINGMLQSERAAANMISSQRSMARLQAVADMARADSIQLFNYGLRRTIENWLTDEDTGGITLDLENRTWDEIKKSFAETKFGGGQGENFAYFAAGQLAATLFADSSFGNYRIVLEGKEESVLRELIKKLTRESVQEDDFFEVVECENGDPRNCPKGTFYVNLKVAKLSQEEYERLPRIRVVDQSTGEQIKEVILPRANFRIYVPLRVFKAIAEARALAHFPLDKGEIDPYKDRGLFSPRIHNMIDEMALGMCDKGYCNPRGNPFTPPAGTSFSGSNGCPGSQYGGEVIVPLAGGFWANVASEYNANNKEEMKEVVSKIAEYVVCNVSKEAKGSWVDVDGANDKFTVVSTQCDALHAIRVNSDAIISKKVINTTSEPSGSIGGGQPYNFDSANRTPFMQAGLYEQDGQIKHPDFSYADLVCPGSGPDGSTDAYCAGISRIAVDLRFKESDPNYMVDKVSQKERIYYITLLDNTYVPFTANYGQGNISNYLYSSAPSPQSCSFSDGWTCATHFMQTAEGCMPA